MDPFGSQKALNTANAERQIRCDTGCSQSFFEYLRPKPARSKGDTTCRSPHAVRATSYESPYAHRMKNEPARVKALAEALSELVAFVPSNKDELKQWYDRAWDLKAQHLKGGEDYLDVPHFLWHYLSDADIRMKDDKYAEMQDLRMKRMLEYLNKGILPEDHDL